MQKSAVGISKLSLKRKLSPNKTLDQTLSISNSLPSPSSLTLSFNATPSFSHPQLLWLMSILIHGYFVLEFLSSGHWFFLASFLGIWFSGLTWRIWIVFSFWCWTNLDPFSFLMLDDFSSMKNSNLIFSSFNFIWLIWVKIQIEIGLNGIEPQSYI